MKGSVMSNEMIQTFDPTQSYSVAWRRLPHWTQAGTACFITWRTADSMPRAVVERWIAARNELLRHEGIVVEQSSDREAASYGKSLERLQPAVWRKIQWQLTELFDSHLDACHGACLLRRRELADIVGESLKKFDGERYELTDFVVMPNHVHILAAFPDEDSMLKQCASWKRYMARRINEKTGEQGEFWQEDAFDHLVRSLEQFDHYRRYIANNGPRAKLPATEYLLYSKM